MSPSQGGGSRLQKLLRLIDGGATLETRRAAAKQIASITASHPAQLPSVLAQVSGHLKHKEWDARVAAAHCLGLLAEHFAHPGVADLCQAAGVDARQLASVKPEPAAADDSGPNMLHFDTFQINQVLEQGTPLLASWGEEFDEASESSSNLTKQRQNLKKRLGLGGTMDAFVDTSDMIQDEDLLATTVTPIRRGGRAGKQGSALPAAQKEASQLLADMSGLSARERAAALRRSKSGLKRGLSSQPSSSLEPLSPTKKAKVVVDVTAQQAQPIAHGGNGEGVGEPVAVGPSPEDEWQEILAGRWPFQTLCDQLCVDVLHPLWEVRHGAAAALREILTPQAEAAGVHAPLAADPSGWALAGGSGKRALGLVSLFDAVSAHANNSAWVEDCAIHLLCVLALDRFGDFLSDQVVAPVRETAAQALGAASRPLSPSILRSLLRALRQLSECSEWEGRHGGLLGLKYVLAARAGGDGQGERGAQAGLDADLLEVVLPAALVGLRDKDDDVRAVSAEALLPVAQFLAAKPSPAACAVRQVLWDILLTLEDLSPATASVMTLLAQIYTSAAAALESHESIKSEPGSTSQRAVTSKLHTSHEDWGCMVPRLWAFLRHSLTSVRLAAVRCLSALLRGNSGTALLAGDELVRALRLVFQNLLVEQNEDVLAESQAAWQLLVHSCSAATLRQDLASYNCGSVVGAEPSQDVLSTLCQLASTPIGRTLAPALMLTVPPPAGKSSTASLTSPHHASFTAGDHQQDSHVVGGDGGSGHATRMRLAAAQALGQLAHVLMAEDGIPNPMLTQVTACLRGPTASSRLLAAFTITHWALEVRNAAQQVAEQVQQAQPAAGPVVLPADLQQLLPILLEVLSAPSQQVLYAELSPLYTQLRSQASVVVERGVAAGLPLALSQPIESLGVESAVALASQIPAGSAHELELGRHALQATAATLQSSEVFLHTSVSAAIAVAVVQLGALPPKLNSVIQPLVAAMRREPEVLLQELAAAGLARLCILCARRNPCPNDKIIKNVCVCACGDPAAVPSAVQPPTLDWEDGNSTEWPAGPSRAVKPGLNGAAADQQQDLGAQALSLARRGGEATLQHLARGSGRDLLTTLPKLWEQVSAPLAVVATAEQCRQAVDAATPTVRIVDAAQLQPAVNALHVLEVVGPDFHPDLLNHVLALLPLIGLCCQHPNAALKLAAACCLAALAAAHTQSVIPHLLRCITQLMPGGAPESSRIGALVATRQLIRALGLRLVPYVLLLVVPLIGRMSDSSPLARGLASACFASVVALLPLMDRSLAPPPGLDDSQLATWNAEGGFLQQLLDNSTAEDYKLPIHINGVLRRYQQEGINWLAFLRRFGLHGVLADDMGLGKTLQATAIIAATTFEQREKFVETGSPSDAPRPSLIICPSTLVAHWPYEMLKFVGDQEGALRPLQYQGTPAERAALRSQLTAHDVVVMAYESLRADIEWACGVQWCYCVLDEGHTIRNPASKITQACKRVQAQHRVILSGTPIQNNVLELWSLFDFLMPGFLGTERQFNAKFGKALQVAKSGANKKGGGNSAAGLLALEGLHRQVMPFILRRTKDQVLKDLPPKIVQDVLCEPSALQKALYEDFAKSQMVQQITGVVQGGGLASAEGADKAPHVFQALLYLRKLCSHPLLVLDPQQPQHIKALAAAVGQPHSHRPAAGSDVCGGSVAGAAGAALDLDWARLQLHSHLHHSPKLLALQELLLDCGIGREPGVKPEEGMLAGVEGGAGHRVLVFAQLRAVLDLVESDVLGPMGASFLRIDGGVDSAERFRRVQQFNADPTIDVMLLTTQVGGLGLNLTAADTVIFLEHDWNPMKDLQAMDRAHRLGQQRSVNVYRLLVRGTLEEQIMSLQQFKLDVAATLVNQDNVSLAAMDTSNLLELFTTPQEPPQQGQQSGTGGGGARGKKGGLAAMLEGLGDVEQNEEQYAQEFSLDAFKSKMSRATQ